LILKQLINLKISDRIKNLFSFPNKEGKIELVDKLSSLGFVQITFPIILKDGNNLDLVYSLKDFAVDPDLSFHEFGNNYELIDANGNLWALRYDRLNQANIPGTLKRIITLEDIREIVNNYFKDSKIQNEVKTISLKVKTISEFFEQIKDYF